jgi:hypothetical protein
MLSPWNFDKTDQEKIAKSLGSFRSLPFWFSSDSHPYAQQLTEKLDMVLRLSADWKPIIPPGALGIDHPTPLGTRVAPESSEGITIETPPDDATTRKFDFIKSSKALMDVLNEIRIPARRVLGVAHPSGFAPNGALHVSIGRKPQSLCRTGGN